MIGDKDRDEADEAPPRKPENVAPDAVKDPNEKTEGLPGLGPQGGTMPDGETDPGGS
ncbi:hypothetical protein [Methylobacterium sp. A54F]